MNNKPVSQIKFWSYCKTKQVAFFGKDWSDETLLQVAYLDVK